MTQVNIIVIFVKKNEIQYISSTIVKIAITRLIPNAFLESSKISSLGSLAHIICTTIPSLLYVRLRTTLYVRNVRNLAMTWPLNALHVISFFMDGVSTRIQSGIVSYVQSNEICFVPNDFSIERLSPNLYEKLFFLVVLKYGKLSLSIRMIFFYAFI